MAAALVKPIAGPSPRLAFVVIALAAFAVRWTMLGYPFAEFDEQFYLLAGDRLLHGTIPYVDLWDRKPVGLFLVYAAIRLLGGSGIVQYHLVATAIVIGTAWMVFIFARRFAGSLGALLAALAYMLWLNLASGEGGQSPVFYNPLVLGAAMIVARTVERGARVRVNGCIAMLLIGVAMQIKYAAVFEGVFFGLTLVWLRWREDARASILADATLWIGCALAPTALAAGAYWSIGHLDDFVFANFVSIARRGHHPFATVAGRFAILCAILAPLVALAATNWREQKLRFVHLWLAASIFGVIVFGTYFDHYALPVVAPAAIAAAPAMERRRRLALAMLAIALVAGQIVLHVKKTKRGDATVAERLVAALSGSCNCPYIYDGQPVLYLLGHHCLPSKYAFPSHINFASERDADGMETASEAARIMALRPDRVMTREPAFALENMESRHAVYVA
ncbi:MAG: glycosyltransferase family 39 protein, partial [Sphingomonadaceae bacterium]|nr:glycosyltransferase family 39 protein [Sphingomonadaceae bacterium]